MHYYVSFVQFTDGTHDMFAGLAENGLIIKDYAEKQFGKDVMMTHSSMLVPDVKEITDDMRRDAEVWYRVREIIGGISI